MKNLLKKSWFISLLITGFILGIFFINLWIMSMELIWPYEGENLFSLANALTSGNDINIFSFIIMLLYYVTILPMILSGISFYRKNSVGMTLAAVFFLIFDAGLIVFQSLYHSLSVFSIVLIVINIIFISLLFILVILRRKTLSDITTPQKEETVLNINNTKLPRFILIVNVLSMLIFLMTFIVPLYTLVETSSTYQAIIINVLLAGDTTIMTIVYFISNFCLFLCIFLYFTKTLATFFFDKVRFVNQSKNLIVLNFIGTIVFFLSGLAIKMYFTIQWNSVIDTIAYLPMAMMIFVIFIYAVLLGKFNMIMHVTPQGSKPKYVKIEPLLYVFLLTCVTVGMLFLPIIKIDVISGSYTNTISLTGFSILRDYAGLDQGYRVVAYILIVMLLSVGISFVVTFASYLSKFKQFNSIVKFATIVNVFYVFLVAVSGYYFQIAKEINRAILVDIFAFYGVNLPSVTNFTYNIYTVTVYALAASLFILIIMFFRKAFDREEATLIEANLTGFDPVGGTNQVSSEGETEENLRQFDPCYAFTELDSRVEAFKEDLENRKLVRVQEPSLNGLVQFVVDYASNSRLHLSYTPEDIATFVAGLGASKLSILQGMSGTGKTSLPKIFAEAIFGNCDIIEVESSWKDKNELLGYYNEFSLNYTPKKFTLALYKAALNPEIFTFILLDEMNLSRIEYYFSDFLSLMEHEEHLREIKLINIKLTRKEENEEMEYLALEHGNTLKIPKNIWFIGTANRDESTFVISDKVYDRAHTINFTKRAPKVRNFSNPIDKQYYDSMTMTNLFNQAKQNGVFDAENSELIKKVEGLLAPYNISFGNRILKQIEDFVNIYKACFEPVDVENQAVEKILLSKVVAKLEVKTIDDKEELEMAFRRLGLHQCADFIKRLDND